MGFILQTIPETTFGGRKFCAALRCADKSLPSDLFFAHRNGGFLLGIPRGGRLHQICRPRPFSVEVIVGTGMLESGRTFEPAKIDVPANAMIGIEHVEKDTILFVDPLGQSFYDLLAS